MKCRTCGYEIPSDKNYCPGCGRVLTKAEQQAISGDREQPVNSTGTKTPTNTYRRPASSDHSDLSKSIQAIFSGDADAPEYNDPHTYKSATAHVLEYDEKFMQRSSSRDVDMPEYEDDGQEDERIIKRKRRKSQISDTQEFEPVQGDYDVEQEYDDEAYEESADDAPVRRKISIKHLFICIAVIAGLAIIIIGTYQIGKQIGFWGEKEPASDSAEENRTMGEMAPIVNEPPSADSSEGESDFRIGTYTINSEEDNALLHKNHSLDQVIASIPNLTVIEITEVKDESGKCTYGSYTGWIDMNELVYTPDAKLPEETTTAAETTTAPENTPVTTTAPETTTQTPHPTSTGTYTVDLRGDGKKLNVREEASKESAVVNTIDDGITVTVDQVDGDWGHIITSDGTEGWIYMVYLK